MIVISEKGNFYGIEGIKFIFHGTIADPEVEYKGSSFNYWALENTLYGMYKEDGYKSDNHFELWLKENEYLAYDILDNMLTILR